MFIYGKNGPIIVESYYVRTRPFRQPHITLFTAPLWSLIDKTITFRLSHWSTLSGVYRPNTVKEFRDGRSRSVILMRKMSKGENEFWGRNFDDARLLRITSFVNAWIICIVAREHSFSQLQSRASNSKISSTNLRRNRYSRATTTVDDLPNHGESRRPRTMAAMATFGRIPQSHRPLSLY